MRRRCRRRGQRGTQPPRAAPDPRAPDASHPPRQTAARTRPPTPAVEKTHDLDRSRRPWPQSRPLRILFARRRDPRMAASLPSQRSRARSAGPASFSGWSRSTASRGIDLRRRTPQPGSPDRTEALLGARRGWCWTATWLSAGLSVASDLEQLRYISRGDRILDRTSLHRCPEVVPASRSGSARPPLQDRCHRAGPRRSRRRRRHRRRGRHQRRASTDLPAEVLPEGFSGGGATAGAHRSRSPSRRRWNTALTNGPS